MCYFLGDIMEASYIYSDDILLHDKLYKKTFENTLIYDISYKLFIGSKPLSIRL